MRLALILCTLSAAVCLASGLGQPEAPTKASSYPKKVTTLKKRPTKTPTAATTSTSGSTTSGRGGTSSSGTTTKPSKPRVKIGKTTRPSTVTRGSTKAPALAASFSNLPADDLEFIKELDKQFKLHGDKIKIKVERDNSTGSGGKNSKRTIEGDLGYGYAHQGYDYTPPKFMFYPYSQHDIPATEAPLDTYGSYAPSGFAHPQPQEPEEPQEHQQPPQQQQQQHVTSVTIEPSYSYELKPQTTYETQPPHPTQPQEHQPHQAHPSHGLEQPQIDLPQEEEHADQGGYQEPVIVLRIPGPAKYAAHLQTLLQQYLEIRAAQYLSLLQEAEQNQQQHHHQHQQQQQQQQHLDLSQQYGAPEQGPYHPDVSYSHQLAPTPQPVQYAAIDDVYQSYKGRHQQQQQHQQQVQQYEQPPPEAYYAPTGYQQQTQFYYAQPQSHGHGQGQAQPQLYLIAMAPQPDYVDAAPQADYGEPLPHQPQQQQQAQQQPIYVPESEPPTAPEAEHEQEQEHSLPITENNPRATHTKVIFNSHPSHMYPTLRQYSQQQQQQHHHQEQQEEQQEGASEESAPSQRPYNYHAHGLKMRQGKRSAKAHPEAAAAAAGDQRLQQIREYVREKLGAEMGSAVEYKTTQLLEG
ncbi:alpha-protein kinase 1 [Drosophila miranda]|uniref:alpha-protein kinase 1 n=1 Tax=Drosophila miranda TaxID=7229 RepID=UPI0007E6530A|nr:alpha-protein kinase 1 [Drosophila miranda]